LCYFKIIIASELKKYAYTDTVKRYVITDPIVIKSEKTSSLALVTHVADKNRHIVDQRF
jgi:hypothetical protein